MDYAFSSWGNTFDSNAQSRCRSYDLDILIVALRAAACENCSRRPRIMRIVLRVVGALLVIVGCIWFLQGVNVLPGSFMTGQIRWAVYGGISVVVGIVLLLAAGKRRTLKG